MKFKNLTLLLAIMILGIFFITGCCCRGTGNITTTSTPVPVSDTDSQPPADDNDDSSSEPEPPAGNLKIKEFTYLDGPDGDPISESSFKIGTTFYFQFKVYGFEMDEENSAYLIEDLILESTEGEELQTFDDFFEFNEEALVGEKPADYIFMTNQLSFPENSPPGTYIAHIIVTDENSGETAEAEYEFTLTK